MVTVTTSLPRARSVPRLEIGRNLALMLEKAKTNLDNFVEYPGSIKGEGGWWRVTEWAEHRIDRALKKRGERV